MHWTMGWTDAARSRIHNHLANSIRADAEPANAAPAAGGPGNTVYSAACTIVPASNSWPHDLSRLISWV